MQKLQQKHVKMIYSKGVYMLDKRKEGIRKQSNSNYKCLQWIKYCDFFRVTHIFVLLKYEEKQWI